MGKDNESGRGSMHERDEPVMLEAQTRFVKAQYRYGDGNFILTLPVQGAWLESTGFKGGALVKIVAVSGALLIKPVVEEERENVV